MPQAIKFLGMIAGACMPLWNIPLIWRIWKRKSSEDISILWVIGVWACIIGLLPSALVSADQVFKIFGITNAVLFSFVLLAVLKFHRKDS